MTYRFPKKILGSRISLNYQRLMKILRRTKEKSYEVSKIWPLLKGFGERNMVGGLQVQLEEYGGGSIGQIQMGTSNCRFTAGSDKA